MFGGTQRLEYYGTINRIECGFDHIAAKPKHSSTLKKVLKPANAFV
jgi:hypothetical protein